MRIKSTLIILNLFISFTVITAIADDKPVLVPGKFSRLYIPEGFDSNDNVQVVGEGYLPDNRYRYAATAIEVDHRTKKITLTSTLFKYSGEGLGVTFPFNNELNFGVLGDGTYTIVQAYDNKEIAQIHIGASTRAEADDYLYASVTQAFLKVGRCSKDVLLTGNFPLSCMKLKEVRAIPQGNVFVLQPIVEINKSEPCKEGQFPFQTSVDANNLELKKRYLLHVRSMNGKAINSLVDIPARKSAGSDDNANLKTRNCK